MILLKKAKVYRGGLTATYMAQESNDVRATVDDDGTVSLWTAIASKGGGTTEVQLNLSMDDVAIIIKELVREGGIPAMRKVLAASDAALATAGSEVARNLGGLASLLESTAKRAERAIVAKPAPELGHQRMSEFGDAMKLVHLIGEAVRGAGNSLRSGRGQ